MEPAPVDPWYDFLAFPGAPLLLMAQLFALFASDRRVRFGVSVVVLLALAVMFVYLATLELEPSEGANIGAGIVFFALLVSLAMLPFLGVQKVVNAVRRRRDSRSRAGE